MRSFGRAHLYGFCFSILFLLAYGLFAPGGTKENFGEGGGNGKEGFFKLKLVDLSGAPLQRLKGKVFVWEKGGHCVSPRPHPFHADQSGAVGLKWEREDVSGKHPLNGWFVVHAKKGASFYEGVKAFHDKPGGQVEIECRVHHICCQGKVYDSDTGAPVDGAVVWVSEGNPGKGEKGKEGSPAVPPVFGGCWGSPVGLKIGFTESNGEFIIPFEGCGKGSRVWAWKRGYCWAYAEKNEKDEEVEILLTRKSCKLGIRFDGFNDKISILRSKKLFRLIEGMVEIRGRRGKDWVRRFRFPFRDFFVPKSSKVSLEGDDFNRDQKYLICLFEGAPSGTGGIWLRFLGQEFEYKYKILIDNRENRGGANYFDISPVLEKMAFDVKCVRILFQDQDGEPRGDLYRFQYVPGGDTFSIVGSQVVLPMCKGNKKIEIYSGPGKVATVELKDNKDTYFVKI